MRELWPFICLLKQQWWWMLLGTLLLFLTILSSIGLLSLSGWFISATAYASLSYALASHFNYFLPAAGVRFFSLARIVGRYGERVISHQATFKLLSDIRLWFYQKIEPLAPAHLLAHHSADLLNRMVDDVEEMNNLYIRLLSPSFVALLIILLLSIALTVFSLQLALIMALLLLLTAFLVPAISQLMAAKTADALAQHYALLRINTVEYIQELSDLSLFDQLGCYRHRLSTNYHQLIELQAKMSRCSALSQVLMGLMQGIILLLLLILSVLLVQHGKLNGAMIALLLLGMLAAFEAMNPLPQAYQYWGKLRRSAQRLNNFTQATPSVSFNQQQAMAISNYAIDYQSIDFAYPGQQKLFHHFSYHIPPGCKLAISGETGVGKSSLIRLLARFWDVDQGAIHIGGIDIRQFPEQQLRSLMTVVSQQSYIFSSSIRENLLLAAKPCSEEAIWQLLATLDLADFIAALPQGLDTWVGDQAAFLSGGQKKRLALARALLKDAPILVLDEPSESLDMPNIESILTLLDEMAADKTLIMVTHHQRLIAYADQVLHLQTDHQQ